MDVLSDVLNLLHLKASVYFHANFCGSWSISSPHYNKAAFHIIERGICWLHMPTKQEPVALHSGDLIFFPKEGHNDGTIHHIISESREPPHYREIGIISDAESTGATTKIICGYFEFESNLANPILNSLPDVVHIKSGDPDNAVWLDSLIGSIYRETESNSLGSTAVIDKLCDVLFVQIIRSWINKKETGNGFLAALSDPQLYQALAHFHASPNTHWSVERLAEKSAMSRSAFAKRFQLIMGITPMYYVAHWRMQRAYELLITTNKSIAQIAEQFTYQSEASFRKAFKQHIGTPPGAVRKMK